MRQGVDAMGFTTCPNTSSSIWPRSNCAAGYAALVCCLFVPSAVWAQTHGAKQNVPVAIVDGQTIYEDDLLPSIQGQLMPLRKQEYDIKKKALDDVIQQKLLDAAAKKKGMTTD